MRELITQNLAAALLAGPWENRGLLARARRACGGPHRWLTPLLRRLRRVVGERPERWSSERLAGWINTDPAFQEAWDSGQIEPWRIGFFPPRLGQVPWPVPSLPTVGALAAWLGLRPRQLEWFAGCRRDPSEVPLGPLGHYTYRWQPKRHGKWRLLEVPKPRLKLFQRRILDEILARIPPHDAAHGFRCGRSVATYVAPHCGWEMVLRFDLCDFFASVRAARVHALFRTAGYPRSVARLLTGLCTHVVPDEVWQTSPDGRLTPFGDRGRFRSPHLPQGTPTSPALANLCAYRLDCRLDGLARAVGARYTRYADDLAFSGGRSLHRCARRLAVLVGAIALEEGFEVNTRKTRRMAAGARQQLAGVVVNVRPNVRRADYDRLKAILTNCIRHGPTSQNRAGHTNFRAHLLGRVAHVASLNPNRGERLRAMLGRIDWERD